MICEFVTTSEALLTYIERYYWQNEMSSSKPALLIAGSSFVRRLERFQHDSWGENLHVNGQRVKFLGLPGKGVQDVSRSLLEQPHGPYRMVVLHVGNNDLCRISQIPTVVVRNLLALAQQLLSAGTMQVIICQLLYRASVAHFDAGLTLSDYNARVDHTNFLLQNEIQKNANPGVKFWFHHRGVLGSRRLDIDGIHLNSQAMINFRRSIIAALSMSS